MSERLTERLTEQRLAEIRDRLARATPGEWHVQHDADDNDPSWVSATFKGLATVTSTVAQRPQGMLGEEWQHDARLIAHAPADLRDLLDALAGRDHLLAVLAQDSEQYRRGVADGLAEAKRLAEERLAALEDTAQEALLHRAAGTSLAASERANEMKRLLADLDRRGASEDTLQPTELRRDNDRLREALREVVQVAGVGDAVRDIRDVCRKALGENDR